MSRSRRTQVAIIGAGPAGLLLSHLLHYRGIASVIVENRSRRTIEATIRAGVLEQSTVDLMHEIGAGQRLTYEGQAHGGFELRFAGEGCRIDLRRLAQGRVITVYAQHEVLKDLIALGLARGLDIRFEAKATALEGITTTTPCLRYATADGTAHSLACDFIAGCDGGHGIARHAMAGAAHRDYSRIYPFAWFGILAKAPPSSEELIYARHERGFALVSTRSPEIQRLYFQCDPADRAEDWSDGRIWDELQERCAAGGTSLTEGDVVHKSVITLRSHVLEPMQHGRLFLAGDAAHTVPPTGAKGLNLAAADVHVLARALADHYATGTTATLDAYSATALRRIWRAQHFSWWMTSLLHRFPDASEFDRRRQLAELTLLTSSTAAAMTLAENYVGLPLPV